MINPWAEDLLKADKLIKDILVISNHYSEFSRIKISVDNFILLSKRPAVLDRITDITILKTGQYGLVVGIPTFVDNKLSNNEFQVNNQGNWSYPIKFNDIFHINRMLKLQAFY